MPIPFMGWAARNVAERVLDEMGCSKNVVKWGSRFVGGSTSLILLDLHGGADLLAQLVQDPSVADLPIDAPPPSGPEPCVDIFHH
jgi:hypothetical protein